MKGICKYITAILVLIFLNNTFAEEPKNLALIKQDLMFYHDSGQYEYDIDQITQQAQDYLAERIIENDNTTEKRKLAIVFDIDETALSNYADLLKLDFTGNRQLYKDFILDAHAPAVPGTLKLYNYAKSKNVAVFFITGRNEKFRAATEKNLIAAGYIQWTGLFVEPQNYQATSAIPFKSTTRKKISDEGYDIVLSIGDQYSDLLGGFDDRIFKLPNPYYYIP